jgi:hypothetical protein
MTSSFTRILFLSVFIFFSGMLQAQIRFTATASPQNAGKDDYITIRFIAENARGADGMNIPALKDFRIISGPVQESGSNTINNSDAGSFIGVSYIVQPKHKGRIVISSATVIIAGKAYRSKPLTINVSNTSSGNNNPQSLLQQNPFAGMDPFEEQQPATAPFKEYVLRPGENVPDKVSKNMQLRVEADKTTVYEGQPVLATYKLFTRLKSESSMSKNPSFNGFSVIDMLPPDNNAYTKEMLNGREYNVYVIRKAQLYPLQAGTAVLDPATLDNKIQFIKYSGTNNAGAYSIDPNAMVTENVSMSSKPVTITVKPLPETGKPASFKGAVGTFRMESLLEKDHFSTDETGKLIITIGGAGNMQLMTAPDVQWPKEVEAFDAKITDNIDKSLVPLAGTKTFEISFAVQSPGTYKIPAIQYSYFDPANGSYKVLSTQELSFHVTKGTGHPASSYLEEHKKNDSLLNKIFARRWLLILFVAGFIIIAMIFWLSGDKKKEKEKEEEVIKAAEAVAVSPIEEAAATSQSNPLAKTEECLLQEECVEFYSVLSNELKACFSQKLGINAAYINAKTLSAAMDKAGIENDTSLLAQQLLRDIEWQLYTPFEHNEMLNEMYARAQTIIQMMNVQRS